MRNLSETPLVTVVIPTYRRANKLPRAIDSVLGQTYRNIEVLIANDNIPGSPEDEATKRRLACYVADGRLREVETGGKTGGGAARNVACRQACGEWLAFLDDDDEFLPDKIETQVVFTMENDLDMSWQDVAWYNEEGKLVEHRYLNHCKDFSRDGLLRAHLLTPICPTSIYLLKKELFDRIEGFGEVATGQDWWLMLRCIEAGARIGYMPEVHVHQYLHKGERLSLGQNKIEGEMARHEAAKVFYSRLSKRDIRFVEFRHNAVLAFACLRSGMLLKSMGYGVRAFATSPGACFAKGLEFFTRGKR